MVDGAAQAGNGSSSAVRVARELRAVLSRVHRRLREIGPEDGLTPSQTAVLARLSKDGACSASDLAAAERIRPQSMAASLAVLEQQGLVRREPDPEDGRRQLVQLSETGRQRLDGDRQARQEWLARALQDHYTERERTLLIEALGLLDRLTES